MTASHGELQYATSAPPARRARWHSQTGLTMIELLVALVLSSFIAIAAVSSLVVARRGFSTLDAASQLRDNGRFATEVIQRVVAQAGYLDVYDAVNARSGSTPVSGATTPPPYTFGFNNALLAGTVAPLPTDTYASANGVNGSDILVLRYQTPASTPGGTVGDKTTINCAGISETAASTALEDLTVSVFHVQVVNNEPTLMCSSQNATGTWVTTPFPLIQGVESFQVLYGVDGVVPGTAAASATKDLIADRFVRADQIAGSGTAAQIAEKWRRVRSVRIGMVLRGPANSAQDAGGGVVYFPLGENMTATGTTDVGARFTAPADGRLRQTVNFTIYLRNDQAL